MTEYRKKTFLDKIPPLPGVYMMKDQKGKIIYVGKAKNLKNRTASYFVDQHSDMKVRVMAPQVCDIEYIITFNETEALLLESSLIKKHQPVFNVMLKDDKRYPYIRLTINEKYPVLMLARKKVPDGSLYWGPYPHSGNVREIIEILTETFKIRTCRKMIRRNRPCLNFYIHKCLGVCCSGSENDQVYSENCKLIARLLDGGIDEIIRLFQARMNDFSEREEYEEAARIRDRIKLLNWLEEKQLVFDLKNREIDIIAYSGNDSVCLLEVFSVRGGSILGKEILRYEGSLEEFKEHVDVLVLEYYKNNSIDFPGKIAVPDEFSEDHIHVLAPAFQQLSGRTVKFIKPRRGELSKLMKLLKLNISRDIIRDNEKSRVTKFETIREEAMQCFGLAEFRQIDTVDISNLGVHYPVGAIVVNKMGEFSKNDYRKFKIREVIDQQNDFAMIKEVVTRKFRRILDEKKPLPDILMIDGGKGQISSAAEAFSELGIEGVCLISIAKEMEEIFMITEHQDIRIVDMKKYRKLHNFLIRNRDEVHRFAVQFHRQRRQKGSLKGILDAIYGIGPKRKKLLLQHFDSLDAILESGIEGLTALPGISASVAAEIIGTISSSRDGAE